MISQGLIESVRVEEEPVPCSQCRSTSRVGRGLCLNCLLYRGLGAETCDNEDDSLEAALDEVDVRDADWRLGNYQILDEIGRGGMGVIYRARQRHSRRIVALKRILAYHSDSRETLVRFRREAEAAASLDHPNILPIYEVGESEDGLPFFTMKFAGGGSLLDSHAALHRDPRRSVALMAKVARAVQCAHGQGILHRDLKPGNILLDGRGEPLVSDFGLAKWLDTSSDLTRTLTIFGTPGYIAPEQASGSAAGLKPTSDIYSIGAILFDLFAGRPPFLGEHALAVIKQAADKPAPKLRTLVPSADRDLETICAKCLEREPNARYHSAHDLATDLELWLEGRPIIARPVFAPIRVWRWSKRNPKLAASIAACAILVAAAGTIELQSRLATRAAAAAMHSVVVEPFLDLDSARLDSDVSDALATALQRKLSHHGPARVSAVRPPSVPGADTRDSERWNGARTAIQGTKRIRDGKLRLSIRLLNAADGKVLYKKIIETGTPDQGLNIVAKTTGAKLNAILNEADLSGVELAETDPGWRDPSTRELLVSGRALQERRTPLDMNRSAELFQRAVIAQPASALAHSYLAASQWGKAFLSGNRNDLAAAEAAANTALRLNPNIAETHNAESMVLFQQGRFSESLEQALTALELADNSNDYRLIGRLTSNLRMLGQSARAADWYRLTFKVTNRPYDAFMLGDCYADLVDDEHAAVEYKRAASLFPDLPEGWMGLCRLALLQRDFSAARRIASDNWPQHRDHVFSKEMAAEVAFFTRDFDDAEKLYTELAASDPNGGGSFYGAVSYQAALGRLQLASGHKEAGVTLLQDALKKELEALRSAPRHPEILYRVAAIECSLAHVESAVQHLRAATQAGWIDYRSLSLDPRFDLIRQNPEYGEIIDKLTAITTRMRLAAAVDGERTASK
jgi:tetratricopeptide (TPR) repeat protein/tRNA A-37 threonylcarbamoyl transferase component Bud32/TolB-like protein